MSNPNQRYISQEILEASDTYEPETYYGTLSFFDQLKLVPDTNVSYIPLTSAKVDTPTYFVIGILPPATNITNNRLDRSGSIGGVEELDTSNSVVVPFGGSESEGKSVNGVVLTKKSTATSPSEVFYDKFVEMAARLKVDPTEVAAALFSESGMQPGSQNVYKNKDGTKVVVAQGLNQLQWNTARGLGMPRDVWEVYGTYTAEQQLPWVEKFFKANRLQPGSSRAQIYQKNAGGYPNPDGSIYASLAYINSHPDKAKFKDPKGNDAGFRGNKGLSRDGQRIMVEDLNARVVNFPPQSIRDRIEAAKNRLGAIKDSSYVATQPRKDPVSSNWKGEGDKNAAKVAEHMTKAGGTDVNAEGQGKLYQDAQEIERKMAQRELEAMKNTPPLRMLVNPDTFKRSTEKVRTEEHTRKGPITQTHGNGQLKLDISGKVAGFFAIDAEHPDTGGEAPGLTRMARHYSAGYQNFMSLYLLYRNNGKLFTYDGYGSGLSRTLSMVGSVYIYYDGELFIGSFDNLNVTESETSPFRLEYNMQFTCRVKYNLDSPEKYSYGLRQLLSGNRVSQIQGVNQDAQDAAYVSSREAELISRVTLPPTPPPQYTNADQLIEAELRGQIQANGKTAVKKK